MIFGILLSRFGAFLEEQAPPEPESEITEELFTDGLQRIREEISHHFVPLLMLARCDGDTAEQEFASILSHCIALLNEAGMTPAPDEEASLAAYLKNFRPTRMQLDRALNKLIREPRSQTAALIAAARAVIDADGENRPREARFLAQLADDLDDM